jgi:hypothetical protein
MQELTTSRLLPIITGCFLLLLSACKKDDKPIPVVEFGEIRIDATVPNLIYSNTRQIALDARRTHYLNGNRQLSLLWTCTEYPAGKLPRIESPVNAYTNVDSLSVGKYNFRLTVRDTLGNKAVSDFELVVKSDSLLGVPKIIPIPDQVIYLPQTSITLDGNRSISANPLGRSLAFKWFVIEHPAGNPAILIEHPASPLTNISGLFEGSYLFGLEITNELGLKNADTIQVNVMPDTLPGSIKIYENLTWTLWDNGWDYNAILKIYEPDIYASRNQNNTEVMVWDEEKKVWMASNDISWEGDKSGLTIYNYFDPYDYIGKKAKVRVRFY